MLFQVDFIFKAGLALCLASGAWSFPLKGNALYGRQEIRSNGISPVSLNNWGGFSSLDGFDNFYGIDNFDGSRNVQVVVVQEKQVTCSVQRIEIIQQRLVVLQEMAKRIITEQICEVETQTIVFEQFRSSMRNFQHDLKRVNGRVPGYDANIAGQLVHLVDGNGNLNNADLGIKGVDLGKATISPSGSNWNDSTSPASVQRAETAARAARNASTTSHS